MFEALGLPVRIVREAYWVNEVAFWRPDPQDPSRMTRVERVRDTEDDLSEFPHVIVNQARMLAYLRDRMQRSPARLVPFYGLHASDIAVGTASSTGGCLPHGRDVRGARPASHSSM